MPSAEAVPGTSIRDRLAQVRRRVAGACERAGRHSDEIRLIAVTKGFPLELVDEAIRAGVADFGENRVQELQEKASAIPGLVGGGRIRWHLVGSLQRNKARRALELADEFHALDSERLAAELDRRAAEAGRLLPCFVQVNVSGEATKSGVDPSETHRFLDWLSALEHLRVVGLMTLAAPAETDDELERVVRPQLRLLAELARSYHPPAESAVQLPLRLSMGMSGDFEIAIEEGATDIRLGTVLFGDRPS
jgi:PLP dependent protein